MSESTIRLRVRFNAVKADLGRVRGLVAQALRRAPEFGDDEVQEILLGIQESMTNIARHAYPEGHRPAEPVVWLDVLLRSGHRGPLFFARIRDRGQPFDRQAVAGGADRRLRKPGESGHGLLLIDRTMDRARYVRRGPTNVLLLCRKGRSSGAPATADTLPRGRSA